MFVFYPGLPHVILFKFQECASLADRLIQGQVTRAQEAEEMFVIKKELAKMKREFLTVEEVKSEEKEGGQEVPQMNGVAGEGEDGRDSMAGGGEERELADGKEGGKEVFVLSDEVEKQKILKSPKHVCREEAQVHVCVCVCVCVRVCVCASACDIYPALSFIHSKC